MHTFTRTHIQNFILLLFKKKKIEKKKYQAKEGVILIIAEN